MIDTKLKLHTLLPPIAKRTGRIPDTTSLRAFLIADAPPAQIHFPDVRPMVDGMPARSEWPTGLGWGVHGTSSISEASGYMSIISTARPLILPASRSSKASSAFSKG